MSADHSDWVPPTLNDVRDARERIQPHLSLPTPLIQSPALSQRWDADVALKLESATPTSAFKVRGGLNFAALLNADERERGLVTASTGNHGQSIAFAAAAFGVDAAIFMPADANPDKVAAIERLGIEVRLVGERFDDARTEAENYAAERGARYVSPVEEAPLIAGVATAALEVLEDQAPDTDTVIVPLGGGSGVSGWLTVRDGLDHRARIWAAQSAQAPAAHDAWRSGSYEPRPTPPSPKASPPPSPSPLLSTVSASVWTTSSWLTMSASSTPCVCSGTPSTS